MVGFAVASFISLIKNNLKKYLFLAVFVSLLSVAHFVSASVLYSDTLMLSPGWNIVSTPKVLDSHSFSLPETSDNFDIYALNASSTSGWSTLASLGQTEFTPLFGYFINNKSTTTQSLTFNYKAGTTPNERLFERTLSKGGWYSIGVANASYAKKTTDSAADINNPSNILNSVSGNYDSIIDMTDESSNPNINSVSVDGSWKQAVASDINSLNDLRETKGYVMYVKPAGAVYSGFQNTNIPDPMITIFSPNGGETFDISQSIHEDPEIFLYSPTLGNVAGTMFYGEQNTPVISGSGVHNYIFPLSELGNLVPGQYKLKVCDNHMSSASNPGSPVCDLSDNLFTLAGPATLTTLLSSSTPLTGAVIASGGSQNNEADKVTALAFSVNASSSDVLINSITTSLSGTAVGQVLNAYLYSGSEELGYVTLSTSTNLTFNNLNLSVPAGYGVNLTIKVDVRNVVASPSSLTVSVDGATGITTMGTVVKTGSAIGNTLYIQKAGPVFALIGEPFVSKSVIGQTASSTFSTGFTFNVTAQGTDVSIASTGAFVIGVYVNNAQVATLNASYAKPTSGITGSGPYVIADGSTATFTAQTSFVGPVGAYVPAGGIVTARLESATWNTSNVSSYMSDTFRTDAAATVTL